MPITLNTRNSDRRHVFAAIELSQAKWIVAIHVLGSDKTSVTEVPRGDTGRLLALLNRSGRIGGDGGSNRMAQIHTCYEAGYDGFWLHRLLESHGIENWVVDSASIQVSRRKRNPKTDRIDAGGLLRVLMARHRGERVCSVVLVPTPEEEDLKRLHRSRASLLRDRVRHVNRIRALLCLQGIHGVDIARKGWLARLEEMRTGDGRAFPERLLAEVRREAKLLAVILDLLTEVGAEIEDLSRPRPAKQPRKTGHYERHPVATRLGKIVGVGPTFAAVFATEVFYRRFKNRREIASYLGLTPTPYASGGMSHDQGISKAGNPIARYHAIELAWLWLRNQPRSRLTTWFYERVSGTKGRMRRILIVALARKLMIALWRYLETGLVPEGVEVRV